MDPIPRKTVFDLEEVTRKIAFPQPPDVIFLFAFPKNMYQKTIYVITFQLVWSEIQRKTDGLRNVHLAFEGADSPVC